MGERSGESKRSAFYATRAISRDVVVPEYPELGLIAFDSPNDPTPSIRVEDGRIVEIDGVQEADFDLIDAFLASHGIDPAVAAEATAIDDLAFARMVCGYDTPRAEVLRLAYNPRSLLYHRLYCKPCCCLIRAPCLLP